MSDVNPFAAPPADAAAAPAPARTTSPPFEAFPVWKIALMMPLTFGLYAIYWMYRQHTRRAGRGADIWPSARALFHLFFVHRLMDDVRVEAEQADLEPPETWWIATAYVIVLLVENLYSRATANVVLGLVGDFLLPLLFVALRTFFLIQAQQAIDRVLDHVAPDRDRGGRLGAGFLLTLAVFSSLWALGLLGTLLPE